MIHLPVEDFGIPERAALDTAVAAALAHLRAGGHLAVHCNAGLGRTGTFPTCLAHAALGLDADAAVAWVPGAVETVDQRRFLAAWRPARHWGALSGNFAPRVVSSMNGRRDGPD